MARQDYEEQYTHPGLRENVKEEIKASDKGGRKGQWSARKSQLLTREYERRGGGYKGEKGESQKNLEKWTDEEWQTREGDAKARQDEGETKRYLPKEAWENMSEEEKKREGSKKGRQYVSNTEEAREARRDAELPLNGYDDLSVEEMRRRYRASQETTSGCSATTRSATRTARPCWRPSTGGRKEVLAAPLRFATPVGKLSG